MYKYVLKRFAMLIPVLIGVSFIVFSIMALTPGDPVKIILGDNVTAESEVMLRTELGLNDPFLVRYAHYMGGLLKGDLGKSYSNQLSVKDQIMDRFPNTLILAAAAIVVSLIIGIPVGILSAKKQYTWIDNVSMVGALIGVSMPVFWLGLLLVIIFALNLRWLPSQGMGSGFVGVLKSLILPAVSLGLGSAAMVTRMTRSSMLEVIRQDYIDTARSKGVKESRVTSRHMLKNALIPIITVVGLQFGHLLGGAVLTETVFSWPGLGRFVVEAIKKKDTPSVLGAVLFLSVSFSFVNLAIDILYAYVDPRIKSQYKSQ